MTTPFYAPPDAFRGSRVVFPEDEARHAVQVLRKQTGDDVIVVDGRGGWHRVRLGHVGPQQVVGHVLETQRDVGESARRVTIALGILKRRSRLETFVEKAVELGVNAIQPLQTARTERDTVRAGRLHKVAVAALKQCQRSRLPSIGDPKPLDALLADEAEAGACVLMCHEHAPDAPPMSTWLRTLDASAPPLCILVGPEGGFAADEVDAATKAGAQLVSLGPRRLRAETAGIVAATLAAMSWNAAT
jgi:16S rRNA (uracil1498-N3)-methyltransferase